MDKNTDKKLAELAASRTASQVGKPALTSNGKGKTTATADFTIKTDVDDLIKLVERTKEISMADAAKELGVLPQTVESWSIFLEEDGVIEVRYKLTTPYLVAKSTADKEAAIADKAEKTDKKQMLLKDDSAEKLKPRPKPKLESSDISVPHLFKEANKEMDNLFAKSYQLIEEGNFSEANRIYEMIKLENDTLPANLKAMKKEISGSLTKLNKDIIVNLEKYNLKASNEISRYVSSKLLEMNGAITSGNIKKAENTYTDIQAALTSYPSGFESKKADLQSQVIITYRKLLTRKKELLQKYNIHKAGQVMALIREIRSDLQKNDIDAAFKKYEEARLHYNELPEGFSEENEQLSKTLFSLVPEILATKKKYSSDEFNTISSRLRGLVKSTYESLSQGKIEAAERHYEDIKQIYHTLPKEFFSKRIELERELLDLENQLLLKSRDTSFAKLKECRTAMARMLSAAKDYLKRDNVELAEGIYYEMLHVYREIPDGFLEQKTLLSIDTLNLFREILLKYDEDLLSELDEKTNAKYQKLVQVLISLRQDIEDSKYDIIEQKFEEAVDLFGHLPFRFVHENTKSWIEIQTLSDEIDLFKKTKLLPAYKDNPSSMRSLLEEIRIGYANLSQLNQNFPDYSMLLSFVKNNYLYYYNLINRTSIKDIPLGKPIQRGQKPAMPYQSHSEKNKHPAILTEEIEPEMIGQLSAMPQASFGPDLEATYQSSTTSEETMPVKEGISIPPRIDNPNQETEQPPESPAQGQEVAESGPADKLGKPDKFDMDEAEAAALVSANGKKKLTISANRPPEPALSQVYFTTGHVSLGNTTVPSKSAYVMQEEEVVGEPKKQGIYRTTVWQKEPTSAPKLPISQKLFPQAREQKPGQDWKVISDYSSAPAAGITQTISPNPKLVYPKIYIMKEEQASGAAQKIQFQPDQQPVPSEITPDFLKANLVSNLTRVGQQMLKLDRLPEAEDAFTQVLAIDPFNSQAKARLDKIEHLKAKAARSKKQKKSPAGLDEPSFRITKPWHDGHDYELGTRATSFSPIPADEKFDSISSKLDSFEKLVNDVLESTGQAQRKSGVKRQRKFSSSKGRAKRK